MEWSEVINDPNLKNLPFKIELNRFGKLLMSPASNEHGMLQMDIGIELRSRQPQGRVIAECSIQTPEGTKVAGCLGIGSLYRDLGNSDALSPRAGTLRGNCVTLQFP
ncbi:MAG: hypothetical protein R3E95_16795 [Thiolinea sp.]